MKKVFIIIGSCVAIGIVILLLLPLVGLHRVRPHARTPEQRCRSHLSHLGKCMAIYAQDHEEIFPTAFQDLVPKYANSSRIYHCPADSKTIGSITNLKDWCSYVLIPRDRKASGRLVHAFCPPENHKDNRAHVLFVDDYIAHEYKAKKFYKLLEEQELTEYYNKH